MPTSFDRIPTLVDDKLILNDIRLALSPHEEELKEEWKNRTDEVLGDTATFYTIYLRGVTDTPDPADPDAQSVSGYGVHVLRREGDTDAFTFKNDASTFHQLSIKADTQVFFFDVRNPPEKVKVFDQPRPISEHTEILDWLQDAAGPNGGEGTSTGRAEFGHPVFAQTILQISIS